jgi:hypothetical protein
MTRQFGHMGGGEMMKNRGWRVLGTGAAMAITMGLVTGAAVASDDVRTLYAGQTIEVGTVTVSNDATEVCVAYALDVDALADGWLIYATHLFVGADDDFPLTRANNRLGGAYKANPIPEEFPYGDPTLGGVPDAEHCVDLEDLDAEAGDYLYIAAHAKIMRAVGTDYEETESAWADGTRFNERGNWGLWFTYEVQAANLLYDGGFDLTCETEGQWFNPTSAAITTVPANWYSWRAFRSWACALDDDNWYAAQDPTLHDPPSTNLTQAIKQAIDGSVVPSGSTLRLSFDYRSANAGIQVQVYGLAAGQSWQPFPVTGAPLGACTGCVPLLDTSAVANANWTAFSQTFSVPADYVAIAVGVSMGGPTQTPFRGLDNVVLTIE